MHDGNYLVFSHLITIYSLLIFFCAGICPCGHRWYTYSVPSLSCVIFYSYISPYFSSDNFYLMVTFVLVIVLHVSNCFIVVYLVFIVKQADEVEYPYSHGNTIDLSRFLVRT
jgi:hypothetical protein